MDNMWNYWRDKYGIIDAYEEYYSDKCSDEVAQLAFEQARVALYALDSRMKELSEVCND